MDLEIFEYIDAVLEQYRKKKDVYKLIAEEIKEYFESELFAGSDYALGVVYRIKSEKSVREKLIRNGYIDEYDTPEDLLARFQDIIGFRIECKFIDDEEVVYELLKKLFDQTEDGEYYYCAAMPKVRLKMGDEQPQKQKNGFDIYKIDGLYLLGKENLHFEVQIKALVNTFWGEIEHKIVYKNNAYLLADDLVTDLMISIKKSLNMIDGQLFVLYNRFQRKDENIQEEERQRGNARQVERFLAKLVCDTFAELMQKQIGFTIDFKASCESVVRYIMEINKVADMEDYGRVMLNTVDALDHIREMQVRVDEQIELERKIYYEDIFSANILETVEQLINTSFKWHMLFLILFSLEKGDNVDDLESFIRFYRKAILSNRSFALLEEGKYPDARRIRFDILNAISDMVRKTGRVEYLCEQGVAVIHRSINYVIPLVISELGEGRRWEEIAPTYLNILWRRLEL